MKAKSDFYSARVKIEQAYQKLIDCHHLEWHVSGRALLHFQRQTGYIESPIWSTAYMQVQPKPPEVGYHCYHYAIPVIVDSLLGEGIAELRGELGVVTIDFNEVAI